MPHQMSNQHKKCHHHCVCVCACVHVCVHGHEPTGAGVCGTSRGPSPVPPGRGHKRRNPKRSWTQCLDSRRPLWGPAQIHRSGCKPPALPWPGPCWAWALCADPHHLPRTAWHGHSGWLLPVSRPAHLTLMSGVVREVFSAVFVTHFQVSPAFRYHCNGSRGSRSLIAASFGSFSLFTHSV